jgi:hypothetical protein
MEHVSNGKRDAAREPQMGIEENSRQAADPVGKL